MIYMLKVNLLIAAMVFGMAGLLIAALFAWTAAAEYARARLAMQRITAGARDGRFAISRRSSRNRGGNSAHVA
jgi:hypothetical protein